MGTEVKKPSIRKQYFVALSVYLGQLACGFSMGWAAPVIPILQDPEQTPLERAITDVEASWIVSLPFIGIIGGPYISGYLCNMVGRKPCLLFGAGMFLISYLLLAVAKSLAVIYVARIFVGFGTGVLIVTNIVYIAELASTRVRGRLLTLTGFFTAQGILIAYAVGPYISFAKINFMILFFCVLHFISIFFMVPESAVYHVMKGKGEEAKATLKSLGRQDDIDEIVAQANEKPKPKLAQLTEMYTVKSNRKAAFIITSLNILTQFSGMMIVITFITVIFDMTESNIESHISTIVIGATQVVASLIAPALVDRAGRKILLLVSCAACSLSLAALGTYFYLYNNNYPIAEDLKWVSLVSVMVFCVAYYSGLGIIPCTFVGEMFTDTCRSFGGTITGTIGWLFGFGLPTAFGYLLPVWGPSVIFWIFSSACAIAFFFTVVFVPETKGKSLIEIQELLSK